MRHAVREQRDGDIGADARKPDRTPEEEKLHRLGPDRFAAHAESVREHVHHPAEQDRLQELQAGQCDIRDRKPDRHPAVGLQESENPPIEPGKLHPAVPPKGLPRQSSKSMRRAPGTR